MLRKETFNKKRLALMTPDRELDTYQGDTPERVCEDDARGSRCLTETGDKP
jgi:hypothetical protein